MKLPAGINRWASGILGVVSLLLVAHLITQFTNPRAGRSTPLPSTARAARPHAEKGVARVPDDLARYDPSVHLEALNDLNARPLPDEDRNPFDYAGVAPAKGPEAVAVATPPPPPPPPPPPIKPMGYNEAPGGQKEAFVSYEDQAIVVHEGDVVGSKYKVLKITSTAITVEDATSHQTTDLPFPQ